MKQITNGGKTYEITGEDIASDEMDTPIGKVPQTVTIDKNCNLLTKEELRKLKFFRNRPMKNG